MLFTPLMYNSRHILHLFTVITVAVLAISCSEHSADRLLASADSLMNTCPDSAYSMLDSLSQQNAHASESLRMRIELLKAKAQNKAYIDFTTDSVMLEAADYFDHHGTPNDRMLAHYLLGCTYRDMKEAPMSLQCYYDAVEAADTTSADCDYGTLCVIYSQMGYLFHQQNSPVHELDMNQKAMHMAEIVHDTLKYLRAYTYCAYAYECLGQEDTAIVIRKNIVRMYDRINRKDLAAAALSALFRHYIENGDLVTARHSLDRYENESGFFNSNGELSSGHELFYYFKGNYYLKLHNVDSAEFYYRKLLGNCTVDNEEAGYRGLMQLYEELGKIDSVAKYARLYTNANDAYSVKHSSEEINRMKALYDYNSVQRTVLAKEQKLRSVTIAFGIVVFCFILLVLIGCLVIKTKHQKARAIIQQKNAEYLALLSTRDKIRYDLQQASDDFSKYKFDKEQELERLQQLLNKSLGFTNDNPEATNEDLMLSSEIVSKLHSNASRGISATKNDLITVSSLTQIMLDDFYRRISGKSSDLSEREIYVCILCRLCFTPSEIAVILDVSQQYITNMRSRINKKLFCNEGAKSLDMSIKMMKC